jgi:hypothetical protein
VRRALVLLLFFVLLPTAAAATRKAQVMLTSSSPVVVRGYGFHARERVAVTVSASETHKKFVYATRRGAIRALFRGFSIQYCEPYDIRAKGSRGSSAFVRVIPDCAPQ